MMFIDTNYFLRYLLNDINQQHLEVKQLFLAGSEGKVALITSSLVFFEIFWVLLSFYKLDKQAIVASLQKVLKFTFIELRERDILVNALNLFVETELDLEDCYNLCYAKSLGVTKNNFRTFDKKLEKEFNQQH